MNLGLNEVSDFKKVIEDLVDTKIKKEGITKYVSAIVSSVNVDGTINVYLPPNISNVVNNILNKTGEVLETGNSVELCSKNGQINNSWVALKHKTNNSGGGGGGTSDYNNLTNKPSINNQTLSGNITIIEDKFYQYNQAQASSQWIIQHNLNKYPSVTIVDSGGNYVMGDTVYNDANSLTLNFSAAFSGKAYLN